MPLTPYRRGGTWWVRGRVEYNGRPISGYRQRSTGASTEAGARDWIREEEARVIRRFLLGKEAEALTFAQAVLLYPANPATAGFLLRIIDAIGDAAVTEITPQSVRALCPTLYPHASTDTWKRQVLTPVSAVINHAHQLGRCPPIRIKGFPAQARIDQDRARGKLSRQPRPAGDWRWIRAVQHHANPWLGAALEFMFETGARVGQAIALEPAHLDLGGGRVWLAAQKGHPAQWVGISAELAAVLGALTPRRPHDRKRGRKLPPKVFGYGDRTGLTAALRRACAKAGEPYLTPHEAGRRGFYTELRVRQGIDPITAAEAGRWSDPVLPDRRYAAPADGSAARAAIRAADIHAKPMQAHEEERPKRRKSRGK